jgi:hypothetical protein
VDCAGEVAGAACCFISSRRNALSPAVPRCAYKTDNPNVSAKKMPANQVVNFTRTFVVCAPKMFSVTPPPNAAPKPSLFGRCIKITSTMSRATRTKNTDNRLIRRFIGAGISLKKREKQTLNAERPTFNSQSFGVGRWAFSVGRLFNLLPNRIHLGKVDVAQFFAAQLQFAL